MHFKNPLVNSQIQDKLINLMDGIIDNDDIVNHIVPVESEVGSNDGQYDLWGLHKSLEQERSDRRVHDNDSRTELNQYLHKNIIKLNEDPLIEWENTKILYPKLYNLAIKYLLTHIPGTSVPFERLFSKAGETVSKARNRLTGGRLAKLLFLQSSDKSQWA